VTSIIERLVIQILVDDTAGPSGTLGESGFSALAEVFFTDSSNFKVLYDTGPSPIALLKNSKVLKINLKTIDAIVLSHGHWDHVGGLNEVIGIIGDKVPLICHPQALSPKYFQGQDQIIDIGIQGIIESIDSLNQKVNLIKVRTPHELINSVMTTGEIPRRNDYEHLSRKLKDVTTFKNGIKIPDPLEDDLSLIFHMADDSVVILCGCCHAGIVNTTSLVADLTSSKNITGIIGGLHLATASNSRLLYTVEVLKQYPIEIIAPCHCSGLRGKTIFSKVFDKNFRDVTVASKIEFTA